MIWPVEAYAPNAATKPSIAAQPLNFSASGVIIKSISYVNKCKPIVNICKVADVRLASSM